jgi:hypothetical protein
MGRIISLLESSALFQAAMAKESLKSSFLNMLVKGAKKKTGDLAELLA